MRDPSCRDREDSTAHYAYGSDFSSPIREIREIRGQKLNGLNGRYTRD